MLCQEKLEIAKKFPSFEDLKDFLSKYQGQERQLFTIKNSKLLRLCKVKKQIPERLKYYEIRYVCKFGQERMTQSTGVRNPRVSSEILTPLSGHQRADLNTICKCIVPIIIQLVNYKTAKQFVKQTDTSYNNSHAKNFNHGCRASISIGVAQDGEHLEIKNFNDNHEGHDGSEAHYDHLPKNRRLDEKQKEAAKELLQLRCNKQFLQQKLATDYNKIVLRKDLTNLVHILKNAHDDELHKAVTLLEKDYGADASILHEDKQFKGLYFSTDEMRSAMNAWPEIVFIDGTYKLFKRNYTLMILIIEDSDSERRVVGVGILSTEERSTLRWFMECFKKENETACNGMRCMMGDKDLTERDVIKELFPGIPMYICIFHTLRTFSREVSTNKMQISIPERNASLKLLDQLTKSSSEQAYEVTYREFCRTVPQPVLNYFNKNWHNIRTEWTKFNMTEGNLGNSTNNRLESMNSKIKQIVKRNSTLTDFVKDFFKWLKSKDLEMSYKKIQNLLKNDVKVFEDGTAEQQYKMYLTKYAFTEVLKEIQRHFSVMIHTITDTMECLIKSQNVMLRVTDSTCECSTWKSISLPCKHIIAVREHFGIPLFAQELCAKRWTTDYNMQANQLLQPTPKAQSSRVSSRPHVIDAVTTPKNLTTSQKRKLMMATMSDMVQLASQCSDAKFCSKLNIIKEIRTYWREGHDVCVSRAGSSPYESIKNDTNLNRSDDKPGIANNFQGSMATTIQLRDDDSNHFSDLNAIVTDLSIGEKSLSSPVPLAESSTGCTSSLNLHDIELGVSVKISGRPKAASKTTLGRPKRKTVGIDFKARTPEAKARIILSWLIPRQILNNVLLGEYKIRKKDIEHLSPETMTDAIVDDLVDLSMVESYFEGRVFSEIKKMVARKYTLDTFKCGTCNECVARDCVLCNSCLLWHHFACVRLKRAPKTAS